MHQNPSHDDADLKLLVRKRAVTQRAWEALYKRFKKLESRGFSQADFARLTGKAPAQISRILARPRNMTLESFAELAHGLGTYPVIELREPQPSNIAPTTEVIVDPPRPTTSTRPIRVIEVLPTPQILSHG